MPDITMCRGQDCPRRNECYRYRAKPDPHQQSWFTEAPLDTAGTCSHLMPAMGWSNLMPEDWQEPLNLEQSHAD